MNGLNQATAIGGASVSHDANGNIVSVPAAGSSTGAGAGFLYNSENVLSVVGSGAGVQEFIPDSVERLSKYYDGTANRWFVYDGINMIGESNASATALARRFVPGPGVDEPLTWYEGSGTSDRRWFHADERGSVVAVSDGSGDLIGGTPNRYDEYGNPQGGAITGRFGYTGQPWFAEAGLYHYRARAYNPVMGRFMQADPIGYGGGMNLYAYVGNNPVNFVDPMGLCSQRGEPPCPPEEDLDFDSIFVMGSRFGPSGQGNGAANATLLPGPQLTLLCFGDCEHEATVTGERPTYGITTVPAAPLFEPTERQKACAAALVGVVGGLSLGTIAGAAGIMAAAPTPASPVLGAFAAAAGGFAAIFGGAGTVGQMAYCD